MRAKRIFQKHAIVALILGLLALFGLVVLSQGVIYTGTVYRCTWVNPPGCTREPLPGMEVYLISSFYDQPAPSTALQVTTSDATGRFWFFGIPRGAVATVRVGNYPPNTWLGNYGAQPYCAFAFNGWGAQSHDIEILSSDNYRTVIDDFGGSYLTLTSCPQALR